jgi:hypothetical protein
MQHNENGLTDRKPQNVYKRSGIPSALDREIEGYNAKKR